MKQVTVRHDEDQEQARQEEEVDEELRRFCGHDQEPCVFSQDVLVVVQPVPVGQEGHVVRVKEAMHEVREKQTLMQWIIF